MPPKKGDPKSTKKGGKDDKKAGKEDKKRGKDVEKPPKGKGKDDKGKTKGKKPVQESEEGSEEEEEEIKTDEEEVKSEEEEDDTEEEVMSKKVPAMDKGKGKAALKGASKAMAMKSFKPPPKHSPPPKDKGEELEKGKKGMAALNLKKMTDVNIKGASKAMMGFAAEGQKKNTAAGKTQKSTAAKTQLKGASKVLTGLKGKMSPFHLPSKQQLPEKTKAKRNLKSTSRLFLQLSKKKKPPPPGKPLLGTSKLLTGLGAQGLSAEKRPGLSGFKFLNKKEDEEKEITPPKKTINLSNLGDKGKMAAEAKGLGGKFKNMFGKKKQGSRFKSKGWMLGRIAAATNWLTGRFLTSMGQGRLGAWAGGRGRKELPFTNRDTRGRQRHCYNQAYEYDDDEYGYVDDDGCRHRSFQRQPISYHRYGPYGEEMDYYDDDDEWEDEYGYYDEEGNFYYDDNEDFYYDNNMEYYSYPDGHYIAEYEDYYGNDGMEYHYGEDGTLYTVEPEPDGYYGTIMDGFSDPYYPELYRDDINPYVMSDPYGMMIQSADVIPGLYNDQVQVYTDPVAMHNTYQQPFNIDAGLDPTETNRLYGLEHLSYPPAETFSSEQFKVPRPQVRLFGQEILEVEPLPPPPTPSHYHLNLPPSPAFGLNGVDLSNNQYKQPLHSYPPAQPHFTVMNQQQMPLSPSTPTTMIIQHEQYPVPPPNHFLSTHLSAFPQPPQFVSPLHPSSLTQDPQMFPIGHMPVVSSPLRQMMPPLLHSSEYSTLASSRPVQRMAPLSSPQLQQRPGSTKSVPPPPSHLTPDDLDFQTQNQSHPIYPTTLHRQGFTQQAPVVGPQPGAPASTLLPRRGMEGGARPSLTREAIRLHRNPSPAQPRSPISSPIASPRGSWRKKRTPAPSSGLSFRPQSPENTVPLPPTQSQVFKERKQKSQMSHSPSSPLPSPQRWSPPLPEKSPPQTFQPTSPRCPTSPSTSHITNRPLPTWSSTRRRRGDTGGRSHVPMHAVKPSPVNPYSQRRSRYGPPVTQHVRPFRSSIHSGSAPPSEQMGVAVKAPRTGSQTVRLRDSKRIGKTQGGFQRPVGRGQPLVRMPRNQPSPGQSFRASLPVAQPISFKQRGRLSSRSSVYRLNSRPLSPQSLHPSSPQTSPLTQRPMSPQGLGLTSFHHPAPHSRYPPGTMPPPQTMTQYDPSPMLMNASPYAQVVSVPSPPSTSAVPSSTTGYSSLKTQREIPSQYCPSPTPSPGYTLQNPNLQKPITPIPLQRCMSPIPGGQGEVSTDLLVNQEVGADATADLSNVLTKSSNLHSTFHTSPLQRNANLYTTVLSPHHAAASPTPSIPSSPHISSAMLTSKLRQTSLSSPLHPQPSSSSPESSVSPQTKLQQGTVRGTSALLSSRLQSSQIKESMSRFPVGTVTKSQTPVMATATTDARGSEGPSPSIFSNAMQNPSLHQATYQLPDRSWITKREPNKNVLGPSHLPSPMLSSALHNPRMQQATYCLPDGTLVTQIDPTYAPSPSTPVLSSALLNPNVRNATYRLPDGTLVTRNESSPETVTTSSPLLSSALLNANVREASYRLPDGSILIQPGKEMQNSESVVSSPGLSSALKNAHLRKTMFQLADGSSFLSTNQNQAPTSACSRPVLSGALENTSIIGAAYKPPSMSLLRQSTAADNKESYSPELSNALRNQNIKSATYRLPEGTLMGYPQTTSTPQTLDLSKALLKNPNLRTAKYRLPDGNIMTRLGAPSTPEPRTIDLSGALQNPLIRGASYRLPSSYAVVSPQVQASVPKQHWAQGPGVEALGLQQDMDVWGAELVLPHGTVQNLNKWSMYRDGELLDPHIMMGQEQAGQEPGEWNLSREGEPQGQWFDKVK